MRTVIRARPIGRQLTACDAGTGNNLANTNMNAQMAPYITSIHVTALLTRSSNSNETPPQIWSHKRTLTTHSHQRDTTALAQEPLATCSYPYYLVWLNPLQGELGVCLSHATLRGTT